MLTEEIALIKKEFLYFRGKVPFLLIFGSFLFHGLLLVAMWPGEADTLRVGQRIFSFFMLTAFSFFILTNLFIAGISAISFTTEKEMGTYELLKTTFIPPWKFFVAKFLVILFYVIILFATLLPVLALCRLAGGLNTAQIYKFIIITLSTCTLNAFFSILASVSLDYSTDAVRRSYISAFMSMGGFSLIGHFFILMGQIISSVLYGGHFKWYLTGVHDNWASISNPLVSLYMVLFPNYAASPIWIIERWAFTSVLYAIFALLLLPVIFYTLYKNHALTSMVKVKEEKYIHAVPEKKPFIVNYLINHTGNAIFQKELCSQFYFKTSSFGLAVMVMFGLMFSLNYICIISNFDFALLAVVEIISFGFVTIGIASTVITKEIENEQFNLIRGTLITPFQFLFGKFQSLSYGLSFPIYICCICNYLYIFGQFRHNYTHFEKFKYISIYNVELILVFYITLILSMTSGVFAKRTIGASLLAYIVNFLFYGGGVFLIFATGISYNIRLFAFSPFSAIIMFWTNTLSVKNIYLHLFYLISIFCFSFYLATQMMKQRRWVDP